MLDYSCIQSMKLTQIFVNLLWRSSSNRLMKELNKYRNVKGRGLIVRSQVL